VLALEEPYRKALLLYYQEGLSAGAIARQMGVPAGTVRSRISRALDQLRSRLDDQHVKGRAGWMPCLLVLARTAEVAPLAGWLLLGGVAVAAAVSIVVATTYGGPAPKTVATAGAPVAAAVPGAGRDAVEKASPSRETDALVRTAAEVGTQDPALPAMSIAELEASAAWVQHLLRKRMLTPDADEVGEDLAALSGIADVGATRILRREQAEFGMGTPLGVRGGGSYFSFATGSHDYDDESSLSLEQGTYNTARHSGMVTALLPIGDVALRDVGQQLPASLAPADQERWQKLWQPAVGADGHIDQAWRKDVKEAGLGTSSAALLNRTYVLRCTYDGGNDLLVAFRPVAQDKFGQTIVYRVLRRFVVADPRSSMPAGPRGTPPGWIGSRTVPGLLQLLAEIRAEAEPRLLAVPEATRTTWANLLAGADTGISRILARRRFDAVMRSREGGAYFDFVARSHAYEGGVHLSLENGRFQAHSAGLVLDLGPMPLATAENAPFEQDERLRAALELVRDLRPQRDERGLRRLAERDAARGRELGVEALAAGVAGHTYLLHAVHDDHTLLVAFTVLDLDADGATLVWRIVKREGR